MNLGDFLTSINKTKENLMEADPAVEHEYIPFIVNRCMSNFPDTIMQANEMNCLHWLDRRMQYEYLLHGTRARSRFKKWGKQVRQENFDLVKQYYGYSNAKTEEIMDLLTTENIEEIKDLMYTGGTAS